ncbi:cytochrome c/FTR1 family iron permease [Marinicella gelatinilytica]|uniref:cytochrome c/FTR1 family iron permease n=1 Tax=Marinicella gelatinilytica TaxID=2996017 RepID=UPI002260CB80|nr:cytochrome c/FTR1 family iron permease [Marinicella gelatinilytica]MCX7545743.1 cytochrome c/FTR1 family iron permease [Marinicella gelatinilytica]
MKNKIISAFVGLLLASLCYAPMSQASTKAAEQTALVQLVEYIGADYINAVDEGQIVSEAEYTEMQEFSQLLTEGIAALPDAKGKSNLLNQAKSLQNAVENQVDESAIKSLAQSIRGSLVTVYGIPVLPKAAPNMAHAAKLYQTTCASCHGITGRGDGPAAVGMEPAPTDFSEVARYDGRSMLGLYTTITQGVDGTGMMAYEGALSETERWALAFYVGQKAVTEPVADQGQKALHNIPGMKKQLSLNNVVSMAPEDVYKAYGEQAHAALGYLRLHPEALFNQNQFLSISQDNLTLAGTAYAQGDLAAAKQAALAAYLDGFEMVEKQVAAVDKPLMLKAEKRFMAVREAIDRNMEPSVLDERIEAAQSIISDVGEVLDTGGLSAMATFSASFFILFREGLEAILVLAALLTFTRKAKAEKASRYIHYGWIGALLAGVLTWYVATHLIAISGASRELTEGIAGVLAALILFYVGFWMHSNANSQKWMNYIKSKVDTALGQGTLWMLAFVAFISVYREIFETILFYQALWTQVDIGTDNYLFYGIAVAIACLAAVTVLFFRIGMRLPLGLFFKATALVLLFLAFVIMGKGVAALQEAGALGVYYVNIPTFDWFGIYPTLQGVGAQLLIAGLGAFLWFKPNVEQTNAGAQKHV